MSVISGRAQFRPPGYEVDLLYLACLAMLVFGGSGSMAIDHYLRKK
jgi:putative oxidoreductase